MQDGSAIGSARMGNIGNIRYKQPFLVEIRLFRCHLWQIRRNHHPEWPEIRLGMRKQALSMGCGTVGWAYPSLKYRQESHPPATTLEVRLPGKSMLTRRIQFSPPRQHRIGWTSCNIYYVKCVCSAIQHTIMNLQMYYSVGGSTGWCCSAGRMAWSSSASS